MNLMDILILAVVFVIIIGIAIAVFLIADNDRKTQMEQKLRCTRKTEGILLCVNQTASVNSGDDYEDYSYYPVVQYKYNNRIYEREYKLPSRLWSYVEANTPIDVFVNPVDENDIYISIPDEVREKNNKKNKRIFLLIIIWIVVGIIGSIFLR